MKNTTKKSKKSIIGYVLYSIIAIILVAVLCFVIIKFATHQNDYIAFIVKNEQGAITTSINNALEFDKTHTFSVSYLYEKPDSKNNVYDYQVQIVGNKSFGLFKDSKAPINFYGYDLSKIFNLKIEKNQFSITIPKAEDVHRVLFDDLKDKNNENIYLFDMCENDYFRLIIYSFNQKTQIDYQFHLSNKSNEIVDTNKIDFENNDINFESKNDLDIEIDIDKIEIENGNIDFAGENDNTNIEVDKIVIENDSVLDFLPNNENSKVDVDKIEIENNKDIEFTS